MNQRVHDLQKWRFLPEGESVFYESEKPRLVVVEVNCPTEVCFYVRQDREAVLSNPRRVEDEAAGRRLEPPMEDDLWFVGICKGRDRLEFSVDGPFELIVEGGSAYIFTAEGQDIATRIVAPVIFTRIANRRQRNPHLEMMQYQMRLNQQRFERQLEEETERRVKALEERLESYVPQRDIRAPPERVGKPEGRDSGPEGEPVQEPWQAGTDATESGDDQPVSRKKRKAAEAGEI